MKDSLRLQKIIDWSGLSQAAFAERVNPGVRPQWLYDIIKEKKTKAGNTIRISHRVADLIIQAFPEVNRQFILLGEGDMLKDNNNESDNIQYIEEDPEIYIPSRKSSPDLLKLLQSLNTNSVEFGQIIGVISQRMESNALQIEILSKEIADVQGKLDKIVDALLPKKQEAKDKR